MKVTEFSTLLIAGSLLLSAAAFAGPTNKKTLHLDTKITVDGKQLEPEDYTFEWTEGSPDVLAKVMQGKTVCASPPAKIVPVPNSNSQNGYELTVPADGSRSFTEISFSGKKYQLQIEPSTSASTAQGANSTGKN